MTVPAIKVLIIDDEDMIRLNLKSYLEDEGLEVHATSTLEETQKVIEERKIDVAIVDMRLPGTDGNELIQRINQMRPEIKFLIHTGTTNYSIPPSVQNLGLRKEDIFMKPIQDMSKLAEAVRNQAKRSTSE